MTSGGDHRQRIAPHLLHLPPPRMSKLLNKFSTAKTGYYGPLAFLDSQDNLTIPLGSNVGCTMHFNMMRNLMMHGDIWNILSMLVDWMFLFLYVLWTTLELIPLTPRSTYRMCAMRYLSSVRYGRMVKSGRSQTTLRICIKNNWIIQWVSQTILPVGPFRYPLHTYLR